MSVFYKYNKNEVEKKIFQNRMYFPNGGDNAVIYTKQYEDKLMEWLERVLTAEDNNYFFNKNVLYKGRKEEQKGVQFDNKKDTDDVKDHGEINKIIEQDMSFLIENILKCTKEIIHNKIASNKNFIDKNGFRICLQEVKR